MPALLGFLIALSITLTGVGVGTLSVPLLMLVVGVPATEAVALGLTFSAAVKLLLAPAQIARGHVSWPVLRTLLVGAIPGVLLGSLLLHRLAGSLALLNAALGLVLIATAASQIHFHFRPTANNRESAHPASPDSSSSSDSPASSSSPDSPDSPHRRPWLLAALMLPVGAEVGFSSAGAGALGSAALLAFTTLAPAQVVGTDILFGAILSLTGSLLHGLPLALRSPLLPPMLLGGVAGSLTGLQLATRLPRRPLRLALWLLLLTLGGQLVHSSLRPHSLRPAHSAQRLAAANLPEAAHPSTSAYPRRSLQNPDH